MIWIQQRRRELNYSQEDLSRELQLRGVAVNRSSIGHWEHGRAVPPLADPAFVSALAEALQLDVYTVLRRCGYDLPATAPAASGLQLSHLAEIAARRISELPLAEQQHILNMIDLLIKQRV